MLTVVTRELVGAGKSPLAAIPGAVVGFLTSVDALVCLEMGGLGVDFDAPCRKWGNYYVTLAETKHFKYC